MREHRIRFALCAGWLLLGGGAVGHAQIPPAVAVSVDPCVPVDHGKLHELLAIELGTSTVQGTAPAAATRVNVSCSALGIELRVEDRVTRKSMARVLPAASFADASSTRLLALAIAEFVVASWIELSVQPAPAVEPVGPPAGEAARRVAESALAERSPAGGAAPTERTLSAGAAVQVWSSHRAVLFGGGLRMVLPLSALLVWTMSADFAAADTVVAYGPISVFTTSAALAIAVQLRLDPFAFQLGPGGRLGFTRIDGDPDPHVAEGDDFIAPYGGPLLLGRIVLHAGGALRLGFDLELGLTTLPARAEVQDEGTALELDGVWFSSLLVAGFAF